MWHPALSIILPSAQGQCRAHLGRGWILLLLGLWLGDASGATQINAVRHWIGPDRTRFVFDTNASVVHDIFRLSDPERIVIDLKQVDLKDSFPQLSLIGSRITQIRSSKRDDQDYRIVLDMAEGAEAKSFNLAPTGIYGHRLVLDVINIEQKDATPVKSMADLNSAYRSLVIAIDAGHGGEDPGAIGPRGTREKDVVLDIANLLYRLIEREPGMRPVLLRQGDYYVSLRQRMQLARRHKADLFISIHADAALNGHASGSSVYVLSQKGATSEAARWLAASQNNSDLIGGVALDDKDELLASVLLDLTQNATLAASTEVGQLVLKQLDSVGDVHKDKVEKAGFVVLKSPDVPSILVESGFISNRKEESQLQSKAYQQQVARAILTGTRRFFQENALPGTIFASADRWHRIRQGDTVSALAREYQVNSNMLKTFNNLISDQLTVGQIIKIPIAGGDQ